jgi:hypothetical protein
METLREALARLERDGFQRAFRPCVDGRLEYARDQRIDPEDLVIEEVVRFEGESDPEDQAVLYALRTADGSVRGTFSTAYGPGMDPASVAVIERLSPLLSRDAPTPGSP